MIQIFDDPDLNRFALQILGYLGVFLSLELTRRLSRRFFRNADPGALHYGPEFKGFAIWSAIPAIALCIAIPFTLSNEFPLALGVTGMMALLSATMILEAFWVQVVYDDETVLTKSPWRRDREIRWEDLGAVTYSRSMRWHKIATRDQGFVRLHDYLGGKPPFLDLLATKSSTENRVNYDKGAKSA
jgi:hypothetical protein